jgi:hypothetical protein
MTKPKLSIVVTTRNDNHGGDLLKRTATFLNGLLHQSEKYKLPLELIIVEWNPPAGKPLLKEVLPAPPKGSHLTLRYIVVPPEIHKSYKHSDTQGLFQMIAKNVGIRRAYADFVLCTNIDILFSDACFQFLAKGNYEKQVFYRNSRCDVPNTVMDITEHEKQLEFCRKNIIKRIGGKNYIRYMRLVPVMLFSFRNIMKIADNIWRAIELGIFDNNRDMYGIDTEACGDFTLMSKEDWLLIEGYPELDLYSIHIDSMALLAASAMGLKQILLSKEECIYHIHHKEGWESFEKPIDVIRFMEKRPGLDWHFVFEAGKYLYKNRQTWQLNKKDWGYLNETFNEYVF